MPIVSGSYSVETPYGCAAKKHFASFPVIEPCSRCAQAERGEDHPCISGRHFYESGAQADASACCRPYVIDSQALMNEKALKEGALAALEKPIETVASKIHKYEELRKALEEDLAAKRTARAEALKRGEAAPADMTVLSAPQDIQALGAHIQRESDALAGLRLQKGELAKRLLQIKSQLDLAERLKERDVIHGEMLKVMLDWNLCVQRLLHLRQEAKISFEDEDRSLDLNRGYIPLLPPGMVDGSRHDGPKKFFFLRPAVNTDLKKVLAWKALETS